MGACSLSRNRQLRPERCLTEPVAKLRSRQSTGVIVCDDCCTECSKVDSFRKSFAVGCPNENERYDAQVVSLRTLFYVWGSCRNAVFAAFRSPTQRTTHRQKTGCTSREEAHVHEPYGVVGEGRRLLLIAQLRQLGDACLIVIDTGGNHVGSTFGTQQISELA